MLTASTSTVVGIFQDPAEAAAAFLALRQAGFPEKSLALASRQRHDAFRKIRVDLQEAGTKGAAVGALAGGGVGFAAGVAAGAALIPGANLVLLGGLVGIALLGAAAGAAVGTFAGPFVAMGLSEADAEKHAQYLEQGKTVIVVRAGDRHDEARDLLVKYGAYDESMSTD